MQFVLDIIFKFNKIYFDSYISSHLKKIKRELSSYEFSIAFIWFLQ